MNKLKQNIPIMPNPNQSFDIHHSAIKYAVGRKSFVDNCMTKTPYFKSIIKQDYIMRAFGIHSSQSCTQP